MRIVLVDPSRAVQRAMRDLIAQGGHEVLSLYNGQKALDCIKVDTDVRALITSVQLPDISDRKSTRLNSSHGSISYAVFCLIKKKYTDCVASTCSVLYSSPPQNQVYIIL